MSTEERRNRKLKRQGGFDPDFSLEPDYWSFKHLSEAVDEFFQDLPANLTFGLSERTLTRLTPLQRRELHASRLVTLSDALQNLTEQEDIIRQGE